MTTDEQVAELRAKIASLENRIYWLELGRSTSVPTYPYPLYPVFNPPTYPMPAYPVYCETITGHPIP